MNLTDEAKNIASKATSKLVQEAIHERDKTFSRTGDKTDKKDDPISSLVRAAAAGIGFVSEAVHYRQEKKSRSHQSEDTVPLAPEQLNEAIWTRDDQNTNAAAPEPLHPQPTPQPPPKEEEPHDLAQAFLARHPFPPTTPTPPSPPNLPHPIILVQRRPQTRARGFIRAYPPCLTSAGISQSTFLDFIDTLNKALEPNPYLYAINLAGLAGVAAQEPGLMLLGVGVAIATEAVMEGQSRWRGNGFLDGVNEGFWGPRGLGCWVVTWREGGGGGVVEGVGFDGVRVAGREAGEERDFVRRVQERVEGQVRRATKYSSGAVNWSEAAPLIFPPPDETPGPGKKKNAADRAEQWLDEFMDKRAQAKWVDKNANSPVGSTVALPKRAFRSRYADPNHPAASGDIVALLTGGQWQYGHAKVAKEKVGAESERRGSDESLDSREAKGTGSNKTKEKRTGGLMSLLQKDVLYLVIANLPSQVVELP